MQIMIDAEYMLKRPTGDDTAVKVTDYKPGVWVTYHPVKNPVVRLTCGPDYFLANARRI